MFSLLWHNRRMRGFHTDTDTHTLPAPASSPAGVTSPAQPFSATTLEKRLGRIPQKLHRLGSVFGEGGTELHGGKSLAERLRVQKKKKHSSMHGPLSHHVSLHQGLMHRKLGDGIDI